MQQLMHLTVGACQQVWVEVFEKLKLKLKVCNKALQCTDVSWWFTFFCITFSPSMYR